MARLKVILPLSALAILSTLFLVADRRGANGVSITDTVTLDRLLTEGRVANPSFSGVGDGGASVEFLAEEAKPATDDGGDVEASRLRGTWQSVSGAEVTLTGLHGRLFADTGDVAVDGDVNVIDSQGYRLASEALKIDGVTKNIVSPGPVVGTGPATRIEAGGMRIEQRAGTPLAIFTDGVRVIYDPNASE